MTALQVATAYFEAWTSKDLDRAMTYVADDVICDAPAGRIEGAAAFRAFMTPFVGMLISAELIAALEEKDGDRAVLVYDSATRLVASGPACECVTVRDGRIVHNRFIFDRLPFEQARAAMQ
jgi:ketosteroid isomerase-like protein